VKPLLVDVRVMWLIRSSFCPQAYNPLIFLRDPNSPPSVGNTTTLVAISARSSVSIWFSDMSRPFVVLEDLFDRDVLDLSW